jgi:hypothetical protein
MFHEFLRAENAKTRATGMPSSRDEIISDDRCQHFVRDAKINSQEADRVTVRSSREPPQCDDDLSKSALKPKK